MKRFILSCLMLLFVGCSSVSPKTSEVCGLTEIYFYDANYNYVIGPSVNAELTLQIDQAASNLWSFKMEVDSPVVEQIHAITGPDSNKISQIGMIDPGIYVGTMKQDSIGLWNWSFDTNSPSVGSFTFSDWKWTGNQLVSNWGDITTTGWIWEAKFNCR